MTKEDNPKWESGDIKDYDYQNADIKCEGYESCHARIINMYHPSARMSDKIYIERFKAIYGCNEEHYDKKADAVMNKDYICNVIINMNNCSEEYMELCEFIRNIDYKKMIAIKTLKNYIKDIFW